MENFSAKNNTCVNYADLKVIDALLKPKEIKVYEENFQYSVNEHFTVAGNL